MISINGKGKKIFEIFFSDWYSLRKASIFYIARSKETVVLKEWDLHYCFGELFSRNKAKIRNQYKEILNKHFKYVSNIRNDRLVAYYFSKFKDLGWLDEKEVQRIVIGKGRGVSYHLQFSTYIGYRMNLTPLFANIENEYKQEIKKENKDFFNFLLGVSEIREFLIEEAEDNKNIIKDILGSICFMCGNTRSNPNSIFIFLNSLFFNNLNENLREYLFDKYWLIKKDRFHYFKIKVNEYKKAQISKNKLNKVLSLKEKELNYELKTFNSFLKCDLFNKYRKEIKEYKNKILKLKI